VRDSMQDDTSAKISLTIAARTANATVNGTGVDMQGTGNFFRTAMLLVVAGGVTDGTHTVTLQESDDNTTFTAVAAGDLQGSLTAVSSANANTVQRQSYIGSKRYLRASVTTTGATSGGTYGGLILLHQGSGAAVT